ncbi:MAG: hypothetical protein M1830_000649 [Pleopsidium flavum]|nr:MAG: hypothetical protein M1830_000649 [Pleopsidium flavum]
MRLFRGMAYGCISGILSAHSLLVAKSAVELLVRTIIDRINQFNRWQSWMVLLGLVALALSQLYYLHRGLELCSTSILYPFVFCVYNIIAILDGLIYFKQTSRLSSLHALLIAIGTGILLFGVLALSWRLHNDPTTQPPVAQTALGPGMGFVDDNNDRIHDNAQDGHLVDEESALANYERLSLLRHSNGDPRIPTKRHSDFLRSIRSTTQGIVEADEIWGELEDDTTVFVRPVSNGASSDTGMLGKVRSSEDDGAHESTALLRAENGRTYRERRRMSAPLPQLAVWRSSRRSNASDSRTHLAPVGWWNWQWWTRPLRNEGPCPDDTTGEPRQEQDP